MKKYLLVLTTLFFALTVIGQTNIYHPFPDSNAVWVFNKSECIDWSSCNQSDYHIYYYYLNGDTIGFNSNIYHKLYRIDSSAVLPMAYFYGGIREDSNRRIFLSDLLHPENLLYDFSKTNIGDTLDYNYPSFICPGIITSIGSIQLNSGEWRKKYETTICGMGGGTSYVIEGIGAMNDLLEGAVTHEFSYTRLRCFHNDNSFVYNYNAYFPASSTYCNMNYLHVADNPKKSDFKFTISPNPFSSQTNMQTDNDFKDATFTLFTSYGQQVKQIKNVPGKTFILRRDNLPNGIYFIRLTQDNKSFSGTLVITDK